MGASAWSTLTFPAPAGRKSLYCAANRHANGSAFRQSIGYSGSDQGHRYLEVEDGDLRNGSGDGIFVGVTGQGVATRALVTFDLSGSVPAGATVTSDRAFTWESTS